jgi:hypothetical protein
MCWDTKVMYLIHVFEPLTGNKVVYFLQTFPILIVTSQNRSLRIFRTSDIILNSED